MVAETSFVQGSNGAAHAAGSRVVWGASFGSLRQSSQELSVARGVTKIGWIAERLQLSTQIQEAGRRMYQLAVQMNFNAGRPSRLVASSCLYVVCRRNRSPHLLIDFADVMQTPVKVLGAYYIRLVRRLVGGNLTAMPNVADPTGIEVPMVDPSIYIERFSRRLKLGGMQRKVQTTAMRLIQFMHRDWICLGRRPNGLCGAALLIAAYYHGFRCSSAEIAGVVRISEGTLLLRLREMQQTPMALIDRADFEKVDLEALEDSDRTLPPCMKRRKLQEEQKAVMDAERLKAIQDGSLTEMPPPSGIPLWRRASRAALGDVSRSGEGGSSSSSGPISKEAQKEQQMSRYTASDPSADDIEDLAREIASQVGIEAVLSGSADVSVTQRVESLESGPHSGLTPRTPEPGGEDDATATATGAAESLSDIEDEELDMYLLDTEESQHKSDIWHEVNKDYLEEWHLRSAESRRKKLAQAVGQVGSKGGNGAAGTQGARSSTHGSAPGTPISSGVGSENAFRPARRPPSKYGTASSAQHSATMALAKRRVRVNRINVEALESLFS